MPEDLTKDSVLQFNIVQRMGLPLRVIADVEYQLGELANEFATADWIVDALFGTGLTGAVRPPFDRIIEMINASGKRVFAVDIPSGLDCDTGEPLGAAIRAAHTATFVERKLGFRNPASEKNTGHVHVVDIGIGTQFGGAGSLKSG
jgi:NAD(P)H-hydrate epimerase